MANKLAPIDANKLVAGLKLMQNEEHDIAREKLPTDPSWLWTLTHLEPAVYSGCITALVTLAAGVGFVVSGNSVVAITTALSLVMAIVQALWTRGKSIPTQKVVVYKPDPVSNPTKVFAGLAVSSDLPQVINAAVTASKIAAVTTPTLPPFTYPGVAE